MNCKNCGNWVEGNFCSHCGQSRKVDRVNLPNLLAEVSQGVLLIDRGFFRTLLGLFVRPGKTIENFLDGKRKGYFKPISYVLVWSTLYFLLSRLADQGTIVDELLVGFSSYEVEGSEAVAESLSWFSKNYAYTTLLMLPFFSLASFISFLGYKKNYLEHVVLNAYITGQQAVLQSLFVVLFLLTDIEFFRSIAVLLSFGYTFWVFWQLFKPGNRIINIIRSILTYIFYFIYLVLVVGTAFLLSQK